MKKLVFICGPNGVGKSSVCRLLHQRLLNSALIEPEWCRQINPFLLTPEIEALVKGNIIHLTKGYLGCSLVEYVIFSYGFHGSRQRIFDEVIEGLRDLEYLFVPMTLTCSEDENIRRMMGDGRDHERIQRAIAWRHLYDVLPYPVIDSTNMTVEQVVNEALQLVSAASQ